MATKTRDGLNVSKLVRTLRMYPGVKIRHNSNHPDVAYAEGLSPCPITTSTDVKKMVVPWLNQLYGGVNGRQIYDSLKRGEVLKW
ncbi:hypothetical protein KY337_00405 [Candidatus Woesearchaeota archaeon]|nr:hypothetical protein [Candidatus Woesearchaeota archaeon]